MSAEMNWGAAERSTNQIELPHDAILENRLNTLRDVAVRLLREVESLRLTEPIEINRRVRLYDEVQRFETDLILSALSRTAGNQTRAAQLLGVKLTTLNSKIKRYKIVLPTFVEDIPQQPGIAA